MKLIIACCFLALAFVAEAGILAPGKTQSAAVEGVLLCNRRPAANVKVKLYDDNRGIDLDDLMDEGITDAEGHFKLSGKETVHFYEQNPNVNVYHNCNDENIGFFVKIKTLIIPCLKKFSIMIPDTFITEGEHPARTFDAGKIELSGSFSGESRDCLN